MRELYIVGHAVSVACPYFSADPTFPASQRTGLRQEHTTDWFEFVYPNQNGNPQEEKFKLEIRQLWIQVGNRYTEIDLKNGAKKHNVSYATQFVAIPCRSSLLTKIIFVRW